MTDLDKIDQIIEGLKLASDWEYNGSNFGDMPKKALTTPQARQAIADLLVEARYKQALNDLEAMQDGDSDYDWVLDNQRSEVARLKKGIK